MLMDDDILRWACLCLRRRLPLPHRSHPAIALFNPSLRFFLRVRLQTSADLCCYCRIAKALLVGRCALVTSFQTFKYMAAYSLIQFVGELMLYSIDSMLGDWQFIYIDMLVIAPLAFFSTHFMRASSRTSGLALMSSVAVSLSGPTRTLTESRPVTSLLAPSVLGSIVGQVIIAVGLQALGYLLLSKQAW